MGCGASKVHEESVVKTTIASSSLPVASAPLPAQNQYASEARVNSAETGQKCTSTKLTASAELVYVAVAPLSKPVIPSIPSENIKAFEIPLDDLARAPKKTLSHSDEPAPASSKLSLPKLYMSPKDLQDKLANTEARWKVREGLDRLLGVVRGNHYLVNSLIIDFLEASTWDLDNESDTRRRKRGDMPQLISHKESDPDVLKRRIKEREIAAALNRQREIEKLQAKLARQEQHARRVQERKRAMGAGSNEELRLSWGGEKELNSNYNSSQKLDRDSRSGSLRSSEKDKPYISKGEQSAIGKGSHSLSENSTHGGISTRGSSGRSTITDTTDVGEDISSRQPSATALKAVNHTLGPYTNNSTSEIVL
ncbi:hypothetical protein BDEG_24825 [Batrachochytrium dendrobatidis JEL423]|uniref:Uncharacterized protein n=1 Tax=Batrachochytrium dendrobatidis (strain JEL423) TaxID=403673 RepID=A0A177WM42_BATDL|nr:hypothetical protein BDEG_24825 [Batrachochytrium dendrobatidis JEL423]